MKVSPKKDSEEEALKRRVKLDALLYKIALVVAAVSVYFFFIKLVFL